MLPGRRCRVKSSASALLAGSGPPSAPGSWRAHETHDVLDGRHGLVRDRPGAPGTVGEDRIDIPRIGEETAHLAGDRGEPCDRDVDEGRLEARELGSAVIAK